MSRIAGYICFDGQTAVPDDLLTRMSSAFNLPNAGQAKWKFHSAGSHVNFGLVAVECGATDEQMQMRFVGISDNLILIDGHPEYFDKKDLYGENEQCRNYELANVWLREPLSFCSRLEGSCIGVRFDPCQKSLFVFRDRFGARTLYYTRIGPMFAFSSEIKALLEILPLRKVNENIMCRFLAMNYRMWFGREETFFDEVREIPVANYMHIDTRGIQSHRYWSPPDAIYPMINNDKIYVQKYLELLDKTINKSLLQSKQRLFFVSGGLDAPVIAARASYLLQEKVDCCAAVFPESPMSDI